VSEAATATALGYGRASPLRGALWMTGAVTCFAVMAVAIRLLEHRQNAIDIAFWRSVIGVSLMLPFMLRGLRQGLFTTRRHGMLFLRAALTYLAMTAYFYAVATINIVDAVALNTTLPLWITVLAALLLGERVGLRRWVATAIGFAGALIILRPGFIAVSPAAMMALGSAVLYSGAAIVVKLLSRTEPATRIVFFMNLYLLLIAAGPAAWRWNLPTWDTVPYLLAIGLSGTLAHVCNTRALAAADASFIAPFDFLRLVMVTLAGWLIFNDPGSVWTWVGAIVVFGSATYITRREAKLSRQPKAAAG
jgi:drug/metabolite transporter (DMT)-like permease